MVKKFKELLSQIPKNNNGFLNVSEYHKKTIGKDKERTLKVIARLEKSIQNHEQELNDKKDELSSAVEYMKNLDKIEALM